MTHLGAQKVLGLNLEARQIRFAISLPKDLIIIFLFIARVMPTLPKQDRPAREGARVASVETGLAAAAAKLAQQVSWETEYFVFDTSAR